ncbi:hypothetical protein OIU76_008646 [Salix suchowensis]|nr:hypothetical protein OIU76_008646 [Salix suchowensis]
MGMFANALQQKVLSSDFLEKYLYCLWWGLQNLSSYGQSLSTSTFIGETAFAILIAISGLVFICPFDWKCTDLHAIYHREA